MNKKKPKKKKSTIFSFNLKKVNLFQAWSHYQFLPVSHKVHQFRSYDQGTFLEPFQRPTAAAPETSGPPPTAAPACSRQARDFGTAAAVFKKSITFNFIKSKSATMKNIFKVWVLVIFVLTSMASSLVAQNTSCPAPLSPTVSGVTTQSATLNWTSQAPTAYYMVQFRPAGTTSWQQVTVQQVPFTLTNLLCGIGYEWQVQTMCVSSATNTVVPSGFVAGPSFTTASCTSPSLCPVPTGLAATGITASSAQLSWISPPGVSTFNLRYKPVNSTSWTFLGNVTNPRSLTGLLCGIAYEWQVRSVCSNTSATSNSSWSSSSFFTTTSCQNVCPAPAGTTTSGITVSSATVSWNAVTGAASYTVRYRVAGSATWAFKNSTVTSTSLNNLICGTAYEWQVRSNCATASNTTSGSYSVSSTFTTTSCTTVCPAPSGLAATGITSSGATLSWSTTGANAYQVRYRENVAGSVWTFQQTNGLSISIAGLNPATQYVWQVQSL